MNTDRKEKMGEDESRKEKKEGGGCLKWGLIGCGGLVAVVLIVAVVLFMFKTQIKNFAINWSVNKIQKKVEKKLPEDMDRKKLKERFDKLKLSLKKGTINWEATKEISNHVTESLKDGEFDKKEIKELNRRLDKLIESQKQPAGNS